MTSGNRTSNSDFGRWVRCPVCSSRDTTIDHGAACSTGGWCNNCGTRHDPVDNELRVYEDPDPSTHSDDRTVIAAIGDDGLFECELENVGWADQDESEGGSCDWSAPPGMEYLYHGHRIHDHDHFGAGSEPTDTSEYIVMDANVLGGKPRIKGTRIGVDHVGHHARYEHKSAAEIAADDGDVYPHLTEAQAQAAIDYYDQHPVLIEYIETQSDGFAEHARKVSPGTALRNDDLPENLKQDVLDESSDARSDIRELERLIYWAEGEIRAVADRFERKWN